MNAPVIDNYIESLGAHGFGGCRALDEKSKERLEKLFEVTNVIKTKSEDNTHVRLWFRAPVGTLEECRKSFCDNTDEEIEEYFEGYKDIKEKWYLFSSSYYYDKARDIMHRGVWVNDTYTLSVNDVNEECGFPVDATEFIDWLIEEATRVVEELKNGTYNDRIKKELPVTKRYGLISARDYYDINKEWDDAYLSHFKEGDVDKFLKYAKEEKEKIPENAYDAMTARDFFEACKVCYVGDGKEEKTTPLFKETEEERERYGGVTPREWYYRYADGRDEGLSQLPLDDPEVFGRWAKKEGEFKDNWGGHPYEIRTSWDLFHSIHLYPCESVETGKWYFALSGPANSTIPETVRYYISMKEAGLPVMLYAMDEIERIISRKGYIGILPDYIFSFGFRHSDRFEEDIDEYVNLFEEVNEERIEKIKEKTKWLDEPVVELKQED